MFEKEADKAETKMIVESNGVYSKFKNYKEGFKDGAEFGYNKAKAEDEYITPTFIEYVQKLEQENTELKAQVEKMKCCENCGWFYLQQHWRESKEIDESRMFHCGTCGNKRNWKTRR